jgi:hypothetical protein
MATRESSGSSKEATRADARKLRGGSTAEYRDRPTDDGMKGDGSDEPNAGPPRLPKQGPSLRTHLEQGAENQAGKNTGNAIESSTLRPMKSASASASTSQSTSQSSSGQSTAGQSSREQSSPEPISESSREAIAKAAYARAERRGFAPGYEVEDWLEAEREVLGRH